jgi:hypothetical protein
VPPDKLARFVVECTVEFTGKLPSPGLRWGPGQRWINEGEAFVGIPRDCKLPGGEDGENQG